MFHCWLHLFSIEKAHDFILTFQVTCFYGTLCLIFPFYTESNPTTHLLYVSMGKNLLKTIPRNSILRKLYSQIAWLLTQLFHFIKRWYIYNGILRLAFEYMMEAFQALTSPTSFVVILFWDLHQAILRIWDSVFLYSSLAARQDPR